MKEKKLLKLTIISFLKKGIKKTKQAIRKKTLPNIPQKLPTLDKINPNSRDNTNKIQPRIFILSIVHK